ncbi:MAG: serine protease [Nitrosomonas sp.]|nr:serine protease [Nitrosomonas sp.]UJP00436.1 MAG: serine protease [Nitrosomonas sp.]
MPREISFRDLEFEKIPVTCYSSRGCPYTRYIRVGMPKLPADILDCTFFMYPTREDAENGSNCGGSGFLIMYGSEIIPDEISYIYAVTNAHVTNKCHFLRLNTKDRKTDIFEIDPIDWTNNLNGNDVSICFIQINETLHKTSAIPVALIKKQEDLLQYSRVGIGDDIFMIGRFIQIDSKDKNHATARFGHISSMPIRLKQPNGIYNDTYLLDMNSRTGYSGSPVFIYRTPGTNIEKTLITGDFNLNDNLFLLLGIHCSQYPDSIELKEIEKGKFVDIPSGMTLAIPSDVILDMLEYEEFVKFRKKNDILWKEKIRNGEIARSASPEMEIGNNSDTHKEDFNSLLDAAVREKPSTD